MDVDLLTHPLGMDPASAGAELGTDSRKSTLDPPVSKDDLAQRFRSWYREAVTHKLWKDWHPEAAEDMQFYIGGKGQWGLRGSYADYDKLVAEKRPAISINHVQGPIDLMSGFERSNRTSLKATPQGSEDVESAKLMTWLLMFAQEQTNAADELSDMFEEGNITGMSVIELGVDYTGEKPETGEIVVTRLEPWTEIIWDPYWKKYDFSDARYMLKFKWTFVADLCADYPEWAREIREAAGQLTGIFHEGRTSSRPGDDYGSVRSHPVEDLGEERHFFDPDDARMLVVEGYYRVYYTTYSCFDTVTGTVRPCADHAEAAAIRDADPTRIKIHRQESRKIRMGVVIPAAWLILEEDKNPYPNDDSNYPFVAYVAKRKANVIYGMVRNLKDPQRVENKRWSQIVDTLAKWAILRPMYPKGSLTNPQTLGNAFETGAFEYDKEKGAPSWWHAPIAEITKLLESLAFAMKVNLREVSGIGMDPLGLRSETPESGVALARRSQAAQVVATIFFDNFRKTRHLFGRRLARRVQQVNTTEDVLRLTNELGAPVEVHINPAAAEGMSDEEFRQWAQEQAAAGKPAILRDVKSLKYDVIISEAPATPSARAATFLHMLDLVEKAPVFLQVLADKLLEYSDLPDRPELVERLRRIMPALAGGGLPQPPNPTAGPPVPGSMPPGIPPAPAVTAGAQVQPPGPVA